MGITLWVLCGAAAVLLARIIPLARSRRWLGELAVALTSSLLLGLVATALDFGGWNVVEWRAGLFVFLGAFGAIGLYRGFTMRA